MMIEDCIPPHNIDAEMSILGGILLDPESIDRVNNLPVKSFYLSSHQEIYQACLDLHADHKPTDLLTVTARLEKKGTLEKAGDKKALIEIANFTVSSVNIDGYAQIVLEKYLLRRLLNAGHDISQLAFSREEIEDVFDTAEQKIREITQFQSSSSVKHISESLLKNYEAIEERQRNPDQQQGYNTGFYDFDAMTTGLQPSDLIILAARPSMGKTSLALNIAANVAKNNYPVLIFSLEMSDEQLSYRLLSSESKITSNRLKSEQLQQKDYEVISGAIGTISALPIWIEDSSMITVTEIRSHARQLQAEQGDLGLIVIDYLQLMGGGSDNRVQELSKITRGLKTLAREINCPVMCLSQLNRGVEQRTNKRPTLSDLKDSGSIEQDADIVAMLYREAYYDPDTPLHNQAELIISKHRNGPIGTVNLLFDSELTQFLNLAKKG